MRLFVFILFALLLTSCNVIGNRSDDSDDIGDNCYEEQLVRIIQYNGETTFQFETHYLHPEETYDVEEGEKYIYCIDEDRNIESLTAAK